MAQDKDLFEENSEEQAAPQPEPYTGETPGQLFREAREAKGLTTQQVADNLRLRKVVVEFMEADEYDKLSSPTYVRGYLRSLSKALDVDEARVFEAYTKMGFGEVAPSTITMQSFSKRKVRERNDNRLMLISYLIIAIVIAMAVVWWWQDSNASNIFANGNGTGNGNNGASQQITERQPTRRTETQVREQMQSTAEPEQNTTTDDAGDTAASNESVDSNSPVVTAADNEQESPVVTEEPEPTTRSTTTSNDVDEPEVVADTSREAPVVSENVAANQASLVMEFSGACWIKVTDGTGTDIAIGVKEAGYRMPLTGEPPFDIILCKPEFVELTYNGESVDLSNYRRNRSVTMTLN
jgi:cytoskeleton protein RodZ